MDDTLQRKRVVRYLSLYFHNGFLRPQTGYEERFSFFVLIAEWRKHEARHYFSRALSG